MGDTVSIVIDAKDSIKPTTSEREYMGENLEKDLKWLYDLNAQVGRKRKDAGPSAAFVRKHWKKLAAARKEGSHSCISYIPMEHAGAGSCVLYMHAEDPILRLLVKSDPEASIRKNLEQVRKDFLETGTRVDEILINPSDNVGPIGIGRVFFCDGATVPKNAGKLQLWFETEMAKIAAEAEAKGLYKQIAVMGNPATTFVKHGAFVFENADDRKAFERDYAQAKLAAAKAQGKGLRPTLQKKKDPLPVQSSTRCAGKAKKTG